MKPTTDPTLDELIRLASTGTERVSRVDTGERVVWIKRAAAKSLHIGHYLQWIATIGLPGTIYRPSRPEHGDAATRGEAGRIRAFQARGVATPEILHQGAGAMVLSDVGPTIERQMDEVRRAGDADGHDALLLVFAEGMARLAEAGLVHGRPHPRDCFVRDGRLGFMDLEQDPLAGMGLENAQARDTLFAFGFICDLAMRPQTPDRAFDAWIGAAPAATVAALGRALRQLRQVSWLARQVPRGLAGSDLRRFVASTSYLGRKFGVGSAAPEPVAPSIVKSSDRA